MAGVGFEVSFLLPFARPPRRHCEMKRFTSTLFVLAMVLCALALRAQAAPAPPGRGPDQLCIQILACCELDGVAFQTSTPCACRDLGGKVLDRQPPGCATF